MGVGLARGGRVDRLSAWLGGASSPEVARRFVRYPADGSFPLIVEGGRPLPLVKTCQRSCDVRRAEVST